MDKDNRDKRPSRMGRNLAILLGVGVVAGAVLTTPVADNFLHGIVEQTEYECTIRRVDPFTLTLDSAEYTVSYGYGGEGSDYEWLRVIGYDDNGFGISYFTDDDADGDVDLYLFNGLVNTPLDGYLRIERGGWDSWESTLIPRFKDEHPSSVQQEWADELMAKYRKNLRVEERCY